MNRVIVVGWAPGELEEPYHKNVLVKDILSIRNRAETLNAERYATASRWLNHVSPEFREEIEVFGLWENLCVKGLIERGMERGYNVRVPKGHTIRHPDYPKGTLEEDVMESIEKYNTGQPPHLKKIEYSCNQDEEYLYFRPKIEIPKSDMRSEKPIIARSIIYQFLKRCSVI